MRCFIRIETSYVCAALLIWIISGLTANIITSDITYFRHIVIFIIPSTCYLATLTVDLFIYIPIPYTRAKTLACDLLFLSVARGTMRNRKHFLHWCRFDITIRRLRELPVPPH
jgi:hypothetical protein